MALRVLSKKKKTDPLTRSSSVRPSSRPRRRLTLRERRRRTRLIITLVSFVLVIGAGIGLSRLSFSSAFTLSSVQVKGSGLVSSDEVLALVKEQTASAYLGAFSKNNILLFPRTAIEEKIKATYKTVASAAISFSGVHNAVVAIEERAPAALWCAGTAAHAGECFYMDKSGYIFKRAPEFTGAVYVSYFGVISPEHANDPTGLQFLSPTDFSKLADFVSSVGRLGVQPATVSLEQNGDGTLRLLSGSSILFSRALDYGQTLENLNSIINAEQITLHGTFLTSFDYINVRFGTKAFFKLRKP